MNLINTSDHTRCIVSECLKDNICPLWSSNLLNFHKISPVVINPLWASRFQLILLYLLNTDFEIKGTFNSQALVV